MIDPEELPEAPGGRPPKGYTAEPGPVPPVPDDGPLPLTDPPPGAHVTHPEYDGGAAPHRE